MFRVGDVQVRQVRPADAAGIAELGRLVDPNVLTTPKTMRALLTTEAPRSTERLVGERMGRLVAWAPSGLYQSGAGWFWIGVQPLVRRQGVGSAVYDHIEARLRDQGARRIETTPNDEQGRRFLVSRGFEVSATVRVSEIDPRDLAPAPPPPPGFQVVALRDAIDLAERLFELYGDARSDVPSQEPRPPWTLAEWRAETLDHPLLDLDASVVVLEGREPVSLAWLYSDREGGRAETLMTATRRDRRGRGLASLAKLHSTERAATLGITRILTGNDVDNRPMRAINDRLGFTPTVVIESFAKVLVGG